MGTVQISNAEHLAYEDFKEGNSIQVRVTIRPEEEKEYQKGKTVKVVYEKDELTGKIVSDPLVIQEKTEDGKKTLSLIVENQ
jgi:hypothetical protein